MNLKISVICPFPVEGQVNQQALFYNFKWNKMTLCKRIYAMTKTFFTGSYRELAWHMLGTWKHILKWKEIFDFNVPWNFQSLQTCLATLLKKKKPIYFACFHKRETTFFFWITKRFAQNQGNSLAWFWLIYVLKGRCERERNSALRKQKSCHIQKQPLEVLYKNLTNFTGKHLCQSLFFSLQLY